jgi:hypothetical protein
MNHRLTMLALVASLGGITTAMADEGCSVPMSNWQPREAVQRMAQKQGWTVRRIKIDDGCYKIDGRDASGRAVEVTVDPATLETRSLEYEHDDQGESEIREPNGAHPKDGTAVPRAQPESNEN